MWKQECRANVVQEASQINALRVAADSGVALGGQFNGDE